MGLLDRADTLSREENTGRDPLEEFLRNSSGGEPFAGLLLEAAPADRVRTMISSFASSNAVFPLRNDLLIIFPDAYNPRLVAQRLADSLRGKRRRPNSAPEAGPRVLLTFNAGGVDEAQRLLAPFR
jgi:hypothetical protein